MTTKNNANDLLAFPGAQGFGRHADGGRGGEIVKVTTLEDSGRGSLRWALEDLDGPRIVVFEVGGTIALRDQIQINGDVTVAGQTAPGGITITGGRLRVVDSDVIIRGLEVRPGDGPGQKAKDRDSISVGKRGETVEDVIVDSNSFTWALDETATAWGAPSKVTFSNNIIAEALRDSIHPSGELSFGMLIGDGSSKVSAVGNLLAHNAHRNAAVKDDAKSIEFINNVVHNWGPNGFTAYEGTTAHVIGNVFLAGKDSVDRPPIRLLQPEKGTAYYLQDNVGAVEGPATSKISDRPVFASSGIKPLPSSEVVDHVLSNVGARSSGLDPIDARIIESVRDRDGRIIDSPGDVGGYGASRTVPRRPDRDGDGIPDAYETMIGSNPGRADAQKDADGDGYANIEDYINGLIDGFDQAVKPTPSSPSPAPKRDVAPAAAEPIRLEAEDFDRVKGFAVQSSSVASEGKLIRCKGWGEQRAEIDFEGPSGVYDIKVRYFDENDGVSELTVAVDGAVVDRWDWDQSLGSKVASSRTVTSRTIEQVRIEEGDTLVLSGARHRDELLRIDCVELTAVSEPEPEPVPVPSSAEARSVLMEAEAFNFVKGFRVDKNPHASGGKLIRADGSGEQKAKAVFDGPSGVYDIAIHHFDENDGRSELSLRIDGEEVDAWRWDQSLGSRLADRDTATTRVVSDVRIDEGDSVVLVGHKDGSEPLRIDALEFIADLILA